MDAGDGQQKFPCPLCGQVYKHQSSLSKHRRYECGIEPQFSCPYCVHRSKRKAHLQLHIQLPLPLWMVRAGLGGDPGSPGGPGQDAGRYVCAECGNAYKHGQSLWKHRKFECGKEPSFFCPHCPHQAKRKQHLELHIHRKHRHAR
ncbi:hypothetical protein ONE63_006228 [Megalurothrips usitatus]|uniref:C2H2-type domain-containing protein n=1 Tax=Megalurothrips usitatus TaxID=439358 RepID=A0AAV7XVY9_9NEOP|nr:hypothetical protein ONE63_006228 [Megalurothrips usitatus]